MQVREWGRSGQPVVVLLHALGCHKGWWDWVGPALGSRYHVLAPDFRGHGESGWSDSYGFGDYAADVEQLVGGRPYALVGHSMGGYVGLVVASRGAARPQALVVVDMKTGSTPQELADLQAASQRPGRVYGSLEEAVGRYRLAPPEHAVPAERLAVVARESYRQQPDGSWVERFDRRALAIEPVEPLPLVRTAGCPMLLVRGEKSLVMAAEPAAELAAAAGAPLETMAGLYHHLPLEAPEELAALIAGFLERSSW
ncbi:MAG: alpha/beta fold hydrolase [Bacillota bacterium]